MSNASTTRRVLSDLNVNAFGSPSTIRRAGKDAMNLKRGIGDVEDPEASPAPSRVRSELHPTQETLGSLDSPRANTREGLLGQSKTNMLPHVLDLAEEMHDSDSQHGNDDSTASLIDSQAEGDTMDSQQTVATEMTLPIQSTAALRAENLRLRLRVALFKVQTNQTSIPMSRLQITSVKNRVQASLLPALSQSVQSMSPPSQKRASYPQLLPPPVLKPTAYSARNITSSQTPSSPPYSTNSSPESAVRDEVFRTPALPRSKMYRPAPISSPPDSEGRQIIRRSAKEESLTSSAVRGKAAIGLLGLRGTGQ